MPVLSPISPNVTTRRHRPLDTTASPTDSAELYRRQLDLLVQFLQDGSRTGVYCIFDPNQKEEALRLAISLGLSVARDPHSQAHLLSIDSRTSHLFLESFHLAGICAHSPPKRFRIARVGRRLLVRPWTAVTVRVRAGLKLTGAWTTKCFRSIMSMLCFAFRLFQAMFNSMIYSMTMAVVLTIRCFSFTVRSCLWLAVQTLCFLIVLVSYLFKIFLQLLGVVFVIFLTILIVGNVLILLEDRDYGIFDP
jgi:hypothetical protein